MGLLMVFNEFDIPVAHWDKLAIPQISDFIELLVINRRDRLKFVLVTNCYFAIFISEGKDLKSFELSSFIFTERSCNHFHRSTLKHILNTQ